MTGIARGSRLIKDLKRHRFIYFLMIPGILIFLVFDYYPLYFLQVAFRKYNLFKGLAGSPWVGLDHFKTLFNTKYFVQALGNTMTLFAMGRIFIFPVPIVLAILLNELRRPAFKRTVQTLVYIPHFLSWVIVGGMWATLLSPSSGLVNELLKMFGMEPVFFMASKAHFRWVLIFTDMWKNAGWGTIIYLAAIAGINPELYESAIIDGAGRFTQAVRITLPSIAPAIFVVFILSFAGALNIFEQVFVMQNPVVAEVSETIDTYVYQIGLQRGDISFATAVGLFKNLVSLTLVILTNRIAKKTQGFALI